MVGVDLTPELFICRVARWPPRPVSRSEWVEGDAEELPFEDERFDVVLVDVRCDVRATARSCCARARARAATGRTFRVHQLDPGGDPRRLLPDDGRVRPARPAVRPAPSVCEGSENHVRHIFANTGVTLEFARESVPPPPFDTPGEAVDWSAERFGPLMMLPRSSRAAGPVA